MGQAVLGFLGVILGAVIVGGASVWQEWVVTARERAAQQADREQRRKDVRDAFQRENVLALQGAIEELRRETFTESGQRRQRPPSASWDHWLEKDAVVRKLWARVFDPELRSLVQEFRIRCFVATGSAGGGEGEDPMSDVNMLAGHVNDRIAVLLPELY
jgi:HAMP domain-containing protein